MTAPVAPMTEWARRLAFAGIVGPVVFGLAAVIGAATGDGYRQTNQFVSELAASGASTRPLMTVGFVVLGVSTLALAWSMRILWPTSLLLAVLVALSGITTLAAGTFSCDAGCPTEGARSTSQVLHDVASVPTFLLWLAMALLAAWQFRRTTYGGVSLALGVIQIASIVVLGTFTDRHPDDPVGLVQRIDLLAVGTWFVATAVALRRTSRVRMSRTSVS